MTMKKHVYRLTGRVRCCVGSTTRRCMTHNNTIIVLWDACAAGLAQEHVDARRNTTPLLSDGTSTLLHWLKNMTMQNTFIVLRDACVAALVQQHVDA